MNSFVEKITLYDILGYLFPGCTCLFLVLARPFYYYILLQQNRKLFGEYKVFIGLLFLLFSYILGIALSEFAGRFLPTHGCERRMIRKFEKRHHNLLEFKLANLINQSKLECIQNPQKDNIPYYLRIMYSDIQSDPAYSRIHNYKSAEVMYKNTFMALVIGSAFWLGEELYYLFVLHKDSFFWVWLIEGIIVCLALLYYARWKRFYLKVMEYTILWFEKKVTKETEVLKKGKRRGKRGSG